MAGRTVQFNKFSTTFHDYHSSPSPSPDPTSSNPPLSAEPFSPRRSSTPHGVTLPPSVPTVDVSERVLGTHPGTLPGPAPTSSFSPESLAPRHSPTARVTVPSNSSVHEVLRHGLVPPISYDLRFSDESAIKACPGLTSTVLAQAASTPPSSSIVVTCEWLPRPIIIRPRKHHAVVTVADVLHKIYRELRQGLPDGDYARLSQVTQGILGKAFETRCQLLPLGAEKDREHSKGIKCIDYLNTNTRFLGFARIERENNEGVYWKLKVAPQQSLSMAGESTSDTSW